HAVESGGGQGQCEDCKSVKQGCYQMSLFPFRLACNPSIEVASIFCRLLVRIKGVSLFAHGAEHGQGRHPGSSEYLTTSRHSNRVWQLHGWQWGVPWAVVSSTA